MDNELIKGARYSSLFSPDEISNEVTDGTKEELLADSRTSYSDEIFPTDSYFLSFPRNIDILRLARKEISTIKDDNIRTVILAIMLLFQQEILLNRNRLIANGYVLPPLILTNVEDGSVLMEWNFRDFRIGISIEKKIEDSSWYIASNGKVEIANTSDILKLSELKSLIATFFSLVLSNS